MTSRNLPLDLLVEILSRVPAVSLARLRSTSKEWNALIKDGRFAKKHSANAPRHSSLALLLIDFRVYSFSFNDQGILHNDAPYGHITHRFSLIDSHSNNSFEEVDILNVFHCEGLLLCNTKDNRLVVWNPCTRETIWIQPSNSYKKYDFYALGYDNETSCYKILSMHQFVDGVIFQTEYEIYDFTSNSWRGVVGVTTNGLILKSNGHGISWNGNAYWLACTQNVVMAGRFENVLLTFDFSTEKFGSESVPGMDYNAPLALSVTRQGQQLCILAKYFFNLGTYFVWMATKSKSTGAMSWSKFLTVSRDFLFYRYQFRDEVSFLAEQVKEKKVVLCCNRIIGSFKNIIHIVGEDENTYLNHTGAKPTDESPRPLFLSYVPSLVQIQ